VRLLPLAILLSACSIAAPPTVHDGAAASEEAGQTTDAPSAAPCDFAGTWSVNFLVSGGIAGIQQELLLSSDGQASYTDRIDAIPTTWALESDELQELVRRLELACPFGPQDARPSLCRDCFVYRLEIVSGQSRFVWEADETQVIQASIRSLLDHLEVIRSMAL